MSSTTNLLPETEDIALRTAGPAFKVRVTGSLTLTERSSDSRTRMATRDQKGHS